MYNLKLQFNLLLDCRVLIAAYRFAKSFALFGIILFDFIYVFLLNSYNNYPLGILEGSLGILGGSVDPIFNSAISVPTKLRKGKPASL